MAISEKIQRRVRKLPISFQAEVLDFVEYLLTKTERETSDRDDKSWCARALASAMRGMESENSPIYRTSDLKVVFS
jgi:hypothetical protein